MKKIGFKSKLMALVIVPVIVISLIVSIVVFFRLKSIMISDAEDSLKNSARAIRTMLTLATDGDFIAENGVLYKGGEDMSYVNDLFDQYFEETEVYATLILGDTRMVTSVKNGTERAVGTQINGEIASEVMGGKEYVATNVVVGGTNCVVAYIPLYQDSGEICGSVFTGMSMKKINSSIAQTVLGILLIVAIFMVLTIIVAVILTGTINRVIMASQKVCMDLAGGDFTGNQVVIGTSRGDELGDMARGVNTVKEKFSEAISGVRSNITTLLKSSDGLADTATGTSTTMDDLSRAINGIAEGATSQAQEVTSAANDVAGILSKMEDVNKNVISTRDNTDEMTAASNKVIDTFGKLIDDIDVSIASLDNIVAKMEGVASAVNDVTVAADDINGIAAQTNLLSLNASIEAARAGEAGKGFAVVAGEISQLAAQSKESADKINEIMSKLHGETDTAVELVKNMNVVMNRQKESSSESRSSLESLVSSISNTKKRVLDIKASSDEVKNLCASLNDSVSNL
ncbi:MAG: methyl-accepting chemotaxis protein [Lachnospiraceae bacterium]|nr:methyl-accepting chemotaxis protein [Lachnospiraceae bacterium]